LTNLSVRSLTVSGSNLFAGTFGGGVFLSTNNGASWTAVNTGLTNLNAYSITASGSNLFAGTGGGVFLSTNNGASWTAVNTGLTNQDVRFLTISGSNLFAGTLGGVFISTNNGASWTAVNAGLSNLKVYSLTVSGSNLFAGTVGGGVFLSTNNGTSWTAVNTGLTNLDVYSFTVSGSNLFAGTYGGGVFLSTNNGASWTAVNTGLTSLIVLSLTVSGSNLFAGTDGGVFRSTNNGASWTAVNTGLASQYVLSLTVSGSNLVAGTLGGVFLSTNNGASWTAVNTGLTSQDVRSFTVSGSNLFAGTYGGGVFLSTNNGASWTAVNTGLTNTNVLSLAVSGSNLVAGTLGGVFLSTNNGASWTAVNTGLTSLDVRSLTVSGSNLFAGTNGGGVFISANNGTSWTAVNSGLGNTYVRTLAVNGGNLYAGTAKGVWSRPLSELVVPPTIASFSPASGAVGTTVTLTGTNFSTTPANNLVKFNEVTATVTASTATSITATVPTGATSGTISVTVAGNTATSANFFGVDVKACGVPFLDPGGNGDYLNNQTYTQTFAPVTSTDKVKVSFSSFSLENNYDFLKVYNGPSAASPLLVSLTGTTLPTNITSSAAGGELTFVFTSDEIETAAGWAATITCVAVPTITSLSLASGPVGTSVTIAGTNFSTTASNNLVKFNGVSATVTASTATSITTTVPTGATSGTISVVVGGQAAPSYITSYFTVPQEALFQWVTNAGDLTAEGYNPTGTGVTDQNYSGTWGDFNNDGFEDLFVGGFATQERNYLYKNNGNGTFSKAPYGSYFYSDGRALTWADYNNDGHLDAFAPGGRFAPDSVQYSFILKNNGNATFSKVLLPSNPINSAGTWADTDNDGDVDLILNEGTSVSIYRNDGADVFTYIALQGSTSNSTWSNVAVDANNDGKIDLYVPDDTRRSFFLGNGNNTFTQNTTTPLVTDALRNRGASWADIDNDGDDDAYIMGLDAAHRFYINDGLGNFTFKSSLETLGETISGSRGSAFADINNDGYVDLLTVASGGWRLYVNNGNGTFTRESNQNFKDGLSFSGASFGDYNNDGFLDIVSVSFGGDYNGLYRNKGNSNNWLQVKLKGTVSNRSAIGAKISVKAGGFWRHQQVITTNGFANQNSLIQQFGLASSTAVDSIKIQWPSGYRQTLVNIARNQRITIEEPNLGPPTITSFSPTSGSVGTTVTLTGTNFDPTPANNVVIFGATRATVTAATSTQLAVTVPTGATFAPITVLNTITGLLAYSNSNFTPTFSPNKGSITTADFTPKVDFTAGAFPWSMSIGDLDGDGNADLAVANYGSNTVSVYRNTSSSGSITTSSFAPKVDFVTGAGPVSVAIGDLDGDGKADLAVTNNGSNTVSVFRNTSSSGSITPASFAAKVDFATGTAPYFVAIGDLDGDGKADLAVANVTNNTISVYRNTSTSGSITTANFSSKVDFTTGANPRSVALGDLDGDGKADMAVANYSDNTLSVFRNTCTSGSITTTSFASKVDFTTGSSPVSIAKSDFDADGKADLAVANNTSNTVSVYRNTSSSGPITSASFAPKVDFTTGVSPNSAAIGDLNGDGKADLATTNFNSNTVSVFRNTSSSGSISTASFAAKVDFTIGTGTNPQSLAIGDLDGDGKTDLAVANYTSNTVSVIRNNPVFPPPSITSFAPASGTEGTSITITGANFDPVSANNTATINGVSATVTSSTTTSLTITVPTGATTGKIAVTVNGQTATSATDFTFVTLPGQWVEKNNGLYGGRVSALVADGSNLFAGTNGGGVFLSNNNGASWTAVNTGLTNLYVYSLAVSGSNLFAGTNSGVFLSTNNGTSWTAVNTGLTSLNISSLTVSGSNLFAGTTGGGVFLSTNNGASWAAVNTGLTFPFVGSLTVSGSNLFAGTSGGGVFLSTDNGASWKAVNTGLTLQNVYSFTVSGSNLFAGTAGGGVFLSANNGASWTAVNTGLTNQFVSSLTVSGSNLFAGTNAGVFVSTNNGASWTVVNTGLPTNTYVTSLMASGSNLFAGTGGGVFLSSNNGASWTAINTGLTSLSVNSLTVSGSNLFAGIFDGGVFLSTNNGTSWTAVNTGLTNQNVRSFTVSGSNLFAGTDGSGIFLSANNGASWTAVNTGLTNLYVRSLTVSGSNLFAGIDGGGVFLSTNNGTSWTPVNTGLPSNTYVSSLMASGSNLFAGTNGGVFLSTNNGASWTAVNTGLTKLDVRSLAVNGNNLFAGTWNGGVFLSTNNGASWTAVNTGLTGLYVYSLTVGGSNLFAVSNGGVFLTTNNGASWTSVNTGLTSLSVWSLTATGSSLFAGTLGSGVWSRPLLDFAAAPTITSFTPTGGSVGASVTITGTNFDPTPTNNNVVKFNGTTAVVTASTATSITTTVPTGATSGKITVTIGSQTATSTTDFTVGKTAQTITFAALAAKAFGDAAFTLTASSSSALAVSYTSSNTAVATVSGATVTIVGAGTATITASQAGDATFDAAVDVPQTLTVNKAAQTITFAALAARTFGEAAFALTGVSSSGLAVTYSSSNTAVATVSGNTVTIVGAGTATITASQVGNTNYNAATGVPQTLTVNKAAQTITFAALAAKTFGDAAFALSSTASSGLPVTYASSNTAVATVSGNTITIVGGGTATITASQAGNGNYNAAADVPQTLTVNKAAQTIAFAALAPKTFGNAAFTLAATASSGLAVAYASSNTAVATVAGNTVTIVGAGSTSITASQLGNASYNAATGATQALTVNKADQTITFAAFPSKSYGDAPFTISATASSNLPVTLANGNPLVATLAGNTITIVGAGNSLITGSQAGNANFNAAPNATQLLKIKGNFVSDSLALVRLYNNTNGAGWTNKTNWLSTTIDKWFGVTLSGQGVAAVNLPNNKLTGPVPEGIAFMQALKTLNLSGNAITSIPDFSDNQLITALNVSNNKLEFGSLEPNKSLVGTTVAFNYANQADIGAPASSLVDFGTDQTVTAQTGGTNNYVWKRNGAIVANADAKSYVIKAIGRANMGEYVCEVTNPSIPGLTIKTAPNKILATALVTGKLFATAGNAANKGIMKLLKKTTVGGYDTVATKAITTDGTYRLEKVVLDDYQLNGFVDTLTYKGALPTWFTNTIYWEEANTIAVEGNVDNLNITSNYKPVSPPKGQGIIKGTVTDLDNSGRLDKEKRVKGCGVSVRKVRKIGRTTDEELTLVAYVFSNENGEFTLPELPAGDYRLNIQYPGYPMDVNSFINITIGDGLKSLVVVAAEVDKGQIKVKKLVVTGDIDRDEYAAEVFPNPSTDYIQLRFDTASETRTVRLTDLTGKVITVQTAAAVESNIDVTTLSTGIYLLEIKEKDRVMRTLRVMKE
jgi:ligand-binding sensor domain-containing protein